jgi:hypothetical protein
VLLNSLVEVEISETGYDILYFSKEANKYCFDPMNTLLQRIVEYELSLALENHSRGITLISLKSTRVQPNYGDCMKLIHSFASSYDGSGNHQSASIDYF